MFSKRFLIWTMVLGLTLAILSGFATKAPAAERVALTMFGSPLGSDAHNFAHALGDIINKNHPWLRVSVLETMGSVDNIKSLSDLSPDKRKLHISLSVDGVLEMSLRGDGPFKKTGPITGWRVLCSLYTASPHFMTLDPNIKGPKDLRRPAFGVDRTRLDFRSWRLSCRKSRGGTFPTCQASYLAGGKPIQPIQARWKRAPHALLQQGPTAGVAVIERRRAHRLPLF